MYDISVMEDTRLYAAPILIAADFGSAFRRERKARGLTQERVAQKAGVTRSTIALLESGQNVGLHHVLAALAALEKGLAIVSARPDFDQLAMMFHDEE
jgi:HTH-type transcriptional regulator / antitoxin HipB